MPLLNIFVHSEQCGHTKPDIFSTIPHIGSSVFLQKLISLVTSWSEAICGVVTSTARTEFLLPSSFSVDTSPICSSEVPGGVSMTRTSSAPQTTSFISCATIAFFFGPRQIIASSASARNPTETSYNTYYYLNMSISFKPKAHRQVKLEQVLLPTHAGSLLLDRAYAESMDHKCPNFSICRVPTA